jgi:CO/xanthine dehydrogenase Mo-binding subunit
VPEVEVVLLNQPNERFLGVGEGSQGPTAAAIANGVANATGKRLRALPFTPERVKQQA